MRLIFACSLYDHLFVSSVVWCRRPSWLSDNQLASEGSCWPALVTCYLLSGYRSREVVLCNGDTMLDPVDMSIQKLNLFIKLLILLACKMDAVFPPMGFWRGGRGVEGWGGGGRYPPPPIISPSALPEPQAMVMINVANYYYIQNIPISLKREFLRTQYLLYTIFHF